MKGSSLIVGLVCLAVAAVWIARRDGAPGAALVTDPSLQVVADRWRDAYNAGDADRVAALYAEGGQYLSAHVHARGRDAIRAYFQRGIDAGGHVDRITVLESRTDGTLAYAVGTYEANNAGERVDGRIVLVLERCDQDWCIAAHEVVVRDQP